MQYIHSVYWERARQLIDAERARYHGSEPWSALRRLSNELMRHSNPLYARALFELGLGLARPHVPSLEAAHVNEDGTLGGVTSVDEQAEEAVLACVLGLLATLDGADRVQKRVAAVWPEASDAP